MATRYGDDTANTLTGTAGTDQLYGRGGDDTLDGLGGDDLLNGDGGHDTLHGGDGDDNLYGGAGDDVLDGGVGRDWLAGGFGDDVLTGGDGSDHLEGDLGSDDLDGGAGDDELESGLDTDGTADIAIRGGAGVDHLRMTMASATADLVFDLADPDAGAWLGDTFVSGVERITLVAGAGDDTLTGGALADTIDGRAGDDRLDGGAGDDVLDGGAGSDEIAGGSGSDVARFAGARADHAITRRADHVEVRSLLPGGGVDRVSEVERFTFADGSYLLDANGAASAITAGNLTVQENVATGTRVTTAVAVDAALLESIAFSLTDDAGGRFAIDPVTGDITVADAALIDFESAQAHDVTVQVRDTSGDTLARTFTIAVRDTADTVTIVIDTPDGDYTAPGNDHYTVIGGAGDNVIRTNAGDDVVRGGGGNDTILPGLGQDTLVYDGADEGFDHIDGTGRARIVAASDDTVIGFTFLRNVAAISADGHAGVVLQGSAGSERTTLAGVTLTGIARIDMGLGNDVLTGSRDADTIAGGGGGDLLYGGGGDDLFLVGSDHGRDRIDGGAGTDTIRATADGTVIGVQWIAGVERIDGGGHAGVVLATTDGADSLSLENVAVTGIARIDLGAGDDRFRGSAGADHIVAGAGDDMLFGNGGNDTFVVGDGDAVDGGDGHDTLLVEGGVLTWSGIREVEAITGEGLRIEGTAGGDVMSFTRIRLTGVTSIDAGAGDDTVLGGAGDDRIMLSAGRDSFHGFSGADVFAFAQLADSAVGAADRIHDFRTGLDRVDLAALDADTAAGDQAFAFIGTAAFGGVAGELRYAAGEGGVLQLLGDVDGDARADFQLDVLGASALTAADFLL